MEKITTVENDIDAVETSVTNITSRVTDVETDISSLEVSVGDVLDDVNGLGTYIVETETLIIKE